MFKRIVFVVSILAVLGNASEYDWEKKSSGNGATQSGETYENSGPVQTLPPNAIPADETSWSISVHPLSMLIYTALGAPTITLTVENNLSEHWSLNSRPLLLWASANRGDLFAYGLYEGVRYYTNPGHRGWYISPQIGYEHVSIDYQSDVDYHRYTSYGEVSALIFVLYSGYKFQSGRFVMFSDVGFGYTKMSAKDVDDDDADVAVESGFGFDLNYGIGYAF